MLSFTSQTSFILLFLLCATTFQIGICVTNKTIRCNENDRRSLLIFKEGVVDPSNMLSSWTSEQDCCMWSGVVCDDINGRVSEFDLANHGLQGGINLSLLQLDFLIHLDLSYNHFEYVSIPQHQVSKSVALLHLDFSGNYFLRINDPHWLSQLSSLKYLDLGHTNTRNETSWLQYISLIPSLSELLLSSCGLSDFPSLNYVNFTSLVTLDLSGNKLTSELPDSLFNFTQQLSHLILYDNNFYGHVPMDLFKLPNLEDLSLSFNNLEGQIPDWFCKHEKLQSFEISYNLFNGSIPSCLGNLSSLNSLDLTDNHFTGNLPESIGKLHNLASLGIGGNSLVGVLSEKNFGNLSRLTWLELSSASFKFGFDPKWVPPFQLQYFSSTNTSLGPIFPAWIYTQRSLEDLTISRSGISNIDDDLFWNFVEGIERVDLSENLISGDISNLTIYTKYIDLAYNNFTGGLPHISANVSEFRASHNSFSGSISPLLCHPQGNGENMLSALDLSYNHFTGILPDCLENWKQLGYLDLHSNKLTGELPPSMASLMSLDILDLRDNNFVGKFSFDLSNWRNLQYLLLEGNKFSGSLPTTMPMSLVVMKLRANQFIGEIPLQLCNLSSLMILDLAENKLSGSIPLCLYNIMDSIGRPLGAEIINVYTKGRDLDYNNIWYLRVIDLSSNNLSGEIPKELFGMNQMWSLNLSWNHLTGKIPREIGGMKNLESLDLSHNMLFGEIPSTISNLSFLAWLNLSYNNFYGQIPTGTQIQSFDFWSFVGNLNLCGDPLPKKCNKKKETQTPEPTEENEHDTFLKALYLGMGVGFATGFWAICGSLFLIRAWRHKFFRFTQHLIDQLYVVVALKSKSLREILGTNCS